MFLVKGQQLFAEELLAIINLRKRNLWPYEGLNNIGIGRKLELEWLISLLETYLEKSKNKDIWDLI